MRRKVKEAAAALDYHPNLAAQSLIARRSFLIGLTYERPSPSYVVELQNGALGRLENERYRLVVLPFNHVASRPEELGKLLLRAGLDGVLLAPPACDQPLLLDMIERQKLPDGLSPPPWRYRVAWGRNWTVQTDVDGQSGVTAARVAFLAERYRLAASDATAGAIVRTNHPLAQDPAPVESYFRDEADAAREANRRLALFGKTNSLYRIRLKAHPFVHEIGEEVHVTFPRWDLQAGRSLRIVALTEDTDENATEIIGFG